MIKGLFILDLEQGAYKRVYEDSGASEQINKLVDIYAEPQSPESIARNPGLLAEAEIIFSSWGAPIMDEKFLSNAPKLKVVFFAAGTIKYFITDAFWGRGVRVTSAYEVGAIPVAEYALSQIIFCLKRGWYYSRYIKEHCCYPPNGYPVANTKGMFNATVGVVSLGMIGRLVCKMLGNHDVKVVAYDPYANKEMAARLNVQLCSLDEIFSISDVVTLHTPWLKETEGMIKGRHFASMKHQASFINTARGAIVREDEMLEVLKNRSDLQVVLDVTYPEPPTPGSELYTMPNVTLTPHIAGGAGWEARRMGLFMVDELKRYLKSESLQGEITKQKVTTLA
jgi:phosphoglycerate dehydrogenase-like enzyme